MYSLAHFGSLLILADRTSGSGSFNRQPFAAFTANVCLDAGERRKGVEPATMRAGRTADTLCHRHSQKRLLDLYGRDGSDYRDHDLPCSFRANHTNERTATASRTKSFGNLSTFGFQAAWPVSISSPSGSRAPSEG